MCNVPISVAVSYSVGAAILLPLLFCYCTASATVPLLLFRANCCYVAAAFSATVTVSPALLVRSARTLGRTHSFNDKEEQTQKFAESFHSNRSTSPTLTASIGPEVCRTTYTHPSNYQLNRESGKGRAEHTHEGCLSTSLRVPNPPALSRWRGRGRVRRAR